MNCLCFFREPLDPLEHQERPEQEELWEHLDSPDHQEMSVSKGSRETVVYVDDQVKTVNKEKSETLDLQELRVTLATKVYK